MFNSVILDVLIGLVCSFLGISLITSAVVEAINSLLQTRSFSLLNGIRNLVNDPDFNSLAKALYDHAAVNPRSSQAPSNVALSSWTRLVRVRLIPAYIDKAQFANAFLDITGLSAANAAAGAPGPQTAALLKAAVAHNLPSLRETNPQIDTWLAGVLDRTHGDINLARDEIATWFDNAMDRVGGAFKRQTQLMSFIVAFGLAVAFHIDTIQFARQLWQQPMVVEQLKNCCGFQLKPDDPNAAESAIKQLAAIRAILPSAWPDTQTATAEALAGWCLTAFATLFGAPFWFDMLQTFVRLKGAGPSPAEKTNGGAAAG